MQDEFQPFQPFEAPPNTYESDVKHANKEEMDKYVLQCLMGIKKQIERFGDTEVLPTAVLFSWVIPDKPGVTHMSVGSMEDIHMMSLLFIQEVLKAEEKSE